MNSGSRLSVQLPHALILAIAVPFWQRVVRSKMGHIVGENEKSNYKTPIPCVGLTQVAWESPKNGPILTNGSRFRSLGLGPFNRFDGRMAQWLAQRFYTPLVGGSNPSSPTISFIAE